MSTAASQLRRLLQLIPHLADGNEHPIEEVARQVGADPATLLQDLRAMSERLDEPAGFVDNVQITWGARGVSMIGSDFLRPMRLNMRELCALELGLAVFQAQRAGAPDPAIAAARQRLRALITPQDDNHEKDGLKHAALEGHGDAAHLELLTRAQRERRKVRITYQGGSSDAPRERVVSPYSLVFASGQWYIVACCDDSEGLRFFRLDRVAGAESTDDPFEVPETFDLDDVVAREKLFRVAEPIVATVRYSPNIARWIAEREKRPLAEDGSLTLAHHVGDMHWLVRHVLQYGPDAEVLGPPRARQAVAEALGGMLA
jgi:proteasome accessory factor C